VTIEDLGPLCVFAGHDERNAVLFAAEAQKQTLRAGTGVVFGTFPPTCLAESCNTGPNYQCDVDRTEPHTLVVHSRLSYRHKPGSVCTKGCRPVIAGCETEALEAGKYTVRYGSREFALRVPSVLGKPCFGAK